MAVTLHCWRDPAYVPLRARHSGRDDMWSDGWLDDKGMIGSLLVARNNRRCVLWQKVHWELIGDKEGYEQKKEAET